MYPRILGGTDSPTKYVALDISASTGDMVIGGDSESFDFHGLGEWKPFVAFMDSTGEYQWVKRFFSGGESTSMGSVKFF